MHVTPTASATTKNGRACVSIAACALVLMVCGSPAAETSAPDTTSPADFSQPTGVSQPTDTSLTTGTTGVAQQSAVNTTPEGSAVTKPDSSTDAEASAVTMPDSSTPAEAAAVDTTDSIPFWHNRHFAFTVAWSLGGAPLFDEWQRDLPASLDDFQLGSYIVRGDTVSGNLDTVRLRYEVSDPPNSYSVDFPFGLSWRFLTRPQFWLSLDGAFWFQTKRQTSVFRIDSLGGRVKLEQFIGNYAGAVGLTAGFRIPSQYFSVDNTEWAGVTVGAGVIPLAYLVRDDDITLSSSQPLLEPARDSAAAFLTAASDRGYGLVWSVGAGAIKKLNDVSGLHASLTYVGRWYNYTDLDENDLHTLTESPDPQPLSSISHRFAIRLSLLRARSTPSPVPTPVPAAQPTDTTDAPNED